MSKRSHSFLCLALVCVLLDSSRVLHAQSPTARFEVKPGPSPSVSVELTTGPRRNFSLARSVAGINDLQRRVTNLRLADFITRTAVPFRELQPGEYLADRDYLIATYDVSLAPLKQRESAAHVSWMKDDVGILMLGDLLPHLSDTPIRASFGGSLVPKYAAYMERNETNALLSEPEDAVFYVGDGWRIRATMRCLPCPVVFLSGSWHFTDEEAVGFVGDISEAYRKLFREPEPLNAQIAIAKFPQPTETGVWQAETRGRTVTIISSDMPFRTQSLQRLHEQLRHELFHLWIPNRLSLTGNYDWFYEGFALYQSLKIAVAMNRIRFDDFLDTLSRAHAIDSAYTQRPSLIEASRNRFSGTNTQVYARGMLVAFLADILLMKSAKMSVEDLILKLYARHRKPSPPMDGNQAVIEMMKSDRSLKPLVEKYITGSETIDWRSDLASAGIEDSDEGPMTRLRVKEKLSSGQKTLLDKLGYNNWRKLSPSSR